MKILILMPLDEKWSFIASGIYKNLDDNAKNKTFAMPMFTEWQLATKKMIIGNDLPQNWNIATFGSIVKAREMYKLSELNNDDFILIGNINPQYKFDMIFNFQAEEKDEAYEDLYIEKLKSIFKDEKVLYDNLIFYNSTASMMTLHNIKAAANFISDYIKTDANIDKIKEKYKDTLVFKEDNNV